VPLRHLEVRAELVERAPQEDALNRDARQPEVTGRLQPDLLEGRREVVLDVAGGELAERLGPRDGRLAGLGELGDCAAEFLDSRQPDAPAAEAGHQDCHPVVVAGAAEPVEHVRQHHPVPGGDGGDRIGRPGLADPVGEIELENQRRCAALAKLRQPGGEGRLWHALQPRLAGWQAAPPGRGGPARYHESGGDSG
jgi:hypothetical protein